jgi:hypothetical protein
MGFKWTSWDEVASCGTNEISLLAEINDSNVGCYVIEAT